MWQWQLIGHLDLETERCGTQIWSQQNHIIESLKNYYNIR